jgi:hypothetical protein
MSTKKIKKIMNSELLRLDKLSNNCSGYDNRALGAGGREMPGALGNRERTIVRVTFPG